LTFNATSLNIERLLRCGFVDRIPLRSGSERRRWVFVTKEVADKLDNDEHNFPRASAESGIAQFSAGHLVYVSRNRAKNTHLERLVGVDEVWAMCFRRPRPGGRLLGRFIERDVFVGLGAHDRHDLAGANYTFRAREAIALWDEKLNGVNPVRSDDLSQYLSGVYRDVDRGD